MTIIAETIDEMVHPSWVLGLLYDGICGKVLQVRTVLRVILEGIVHLHVGDRIGLEVTIRGSGIQQVDLPACPFLADPANDNPANAVACKKANLAHPEKPLKGM
jgi:hypothetical protein